MKNGVLSNIYILQNFINAFCLCIYGAINIKYAKCIAMISRHYVYSHINMYINRIE